MICKHCGTKVSVEKVHFSTECEKCNCWLHSCLQCNLWNADSETCKSMTTDSIRDREGKNFCDEWQPSEQPQTKQTSSNAQDKFDSLFGN